MKTYYYSPVVKNQSKDLSKFVIYSYTMPGVTPGNISRILTKLSPENFEYLKSNLGKWNRSYDPISDKTLIEIFDKLERFFKPEIYIETYIIFEIIQDEDENLYGKELLTGMLFPVLTDSQCDYFYNYNEDERITCRLTSKHNNFLKLNYVISDCDVATQNQIEKYIGKKNNRFKRKIQKLYKANVFKKEVIQKKEKVFEKQNQHTKLMEDIELLLELLKKQNQKAYSKLMEEYKNAKNRRDDTLVSIEPTIEDFKSIISKIKLYLILGDFKDLPSSLSNTIESYYLKLVNNELNNQDLSIDDLDNITEMFLISKDDYEIDIQRKILKNISMLYLFVVKSNVDSIDINKLNESYFKDNLKTILLNIIVLNEMEIIKNIPNVSFEYNISVESVFNIIKEIEFYKTDKDKVKNLIK